MSRTILRGKRRASLKEYFPQAIELCNDNLASRLATDFVAKWPTLEAFQQAKPSALKKSFTMGITFAAPR
jgi:hypothetical protein